MIGKYSSVSSIPRNLKPSRRAAFPVEPEPVNGSSTVPFGGVIRRTNYCINAVGLTVG